MAEFNKAPYYDDFDENKKFLQILFQPGRPVQARELTQLQSILQNQVERGAAHIFNQGSKVFEAEAVGGQQGYDSETIQFIKLHPRNKDGNIINVSNFVGKSIRSISPDLSITIGGKVLAATANSSGDPDTIFVRWETGKDLYPIRSNEQLQIWDENSSEGIYYTANVSVNDLVPHGRGSVFETSDGVYFVNGRYIKTNAQTIVVGKYDANVTYRIGFDIIDNIISSSDDGSLLDPASGFSNYTGSGADRYKVDLVLTTKGDGKTISQLQASNTISTELGDIVASNTFFEVARIVDGKLTRKVQTPLYSELENLLARKIYDQSGNFTISGHKPLLEEKSVRGEGGLDGSDEFLFGVEGGKSYVSGFEWNNEGRITWTPIAKARTTGTTQDLRVPIVYTNYITLHDSVNAITDDAETNDLPAKGFFHVNDQKRISLFSQDRYITDSEFSNLGANNTDLTARDGTLLSANVYNSILVGTARAEAFQYDSSATDAALDFGIQGKSYRLYLRDVVPNKVHGTSNGANKSGVQALYYDTTQNLSYYKLDTNLLGVHGFSNTGGDTRTRDMYGPDYVTVQGFNFPGGHWNIIAGEVVDANSTGWIGVRSVRTSTVNNHPDEGGTTAIPAEDNGIITRTTRAGISPRRLILLDENSRALWSDAYNGASITLTSGSAAGETRKIVDYVGGAHVNSITYFQGSEDGGTEFSNTLDLQGVGKRGLAVVDREFSAIPNTSTQYTISFALKNARSVGINANTNGNGYSTADLAYYQSRGVATGAPNQFDHITVGASPNLTTLYNIDAVSGITPAGSIEDNNNTDDIYGGRRISGDTFLSGSLGTLLGATGRAAVQTLKTEGPPLSPTSNTFFTSQRVYENITLNPGSSVAITLASGLYDAGQRFFRYVAGSSTPGREYTSDERNLFIHVVDRATGRVVDFDKGTGGEVLIEDNNTNTGHKINITVPTGYGYFAHPLYDAIVTVIHENVSPRSKTLRKANAIAVAADVLSTGYNLSNGQILIKNSSGNNSLGEISIDQTDGKTPPSYVSQTLGASDVYSVKILDTGVTGGTTLANPTDEMVQQLALSNVAYFDSHATAKDITNNYILDTGQRNHIYDHASLTLRPGSPIPSGQCLVLFDRFEHSDSDVRTGTPQYFSVDSYQHTEDITYTLESGTFSAGDVITGNVSGVRAKVFDVLDNSTKLRAVSLVPFGSNAHFVVGDGIFVNSSSNPPTTTAKASVGAVTNLEITYKNIPKYKGTSRTYNLRDVIDYRPSRADGVSSVHNAEYSVENVAIPLDCSAFDLGFAIDVMPRYKLKSYLGRIDRVLLKKSREIKIQQGIPGLAPVPPPIEAPDGANPSMVLFNVFVPPYTFNLHPEGESAKGGVIVKPTKNKRYTMKEISRIDDRVKNLEYYVALNALEQNAKDLNVTDSQGLSRFKNGILTDNFNAHTTVRRQVGETLDLARGFNEYSGFLQPYYALDKDKGHLWPAETIDTTDWRFHLDEGASSGIAFSGDENEVITLDYQIVPWTTPEAPMQLMASESKELIDPGDGGAPILDPFGEGNGKVNINPFSQYNFMGNLRLSPNFNDFVDVVDTDNVVITNLTGQADALEGLPVDAIQTAQQNGQATFPIPGQATVTETHGPLQSDPGTVSGNPSVVTADSELSMDLAVSSLIENRGDRGDHYHVAAFDSPSTQDFSIELGQTMQQAWAAVRHTPQTTLQIFEDAVVDIAVATHMVPQNISISATSMKPSSKLHAWFSGDPVDSYISSASVVHLSGENNLGRRTGSRAGQSRINEWVTIDGVGPENARAKLVGARANVAYLTEITYSGSPGQKFSDDGITLVGNTTGQTVETLQRDVGASQQFVINATGFINYPDTTDPGYKPSHDHRSGYFSTHSVPAGQVEGHTEVKLAIDAPTRGNALAMPVITQANLPIKNDDGSYSGDTEFLGSPLGTEIQIVRGTGQGKKGTIVSYNGTTQVANVVGFGTGFVPDGTIGAGTRSYYTIASTDSTKGRHGTTDDFITTNEHGEFHGTFNLPGDLFRTGTKILALNDRGDNNPFLIKTWALAPYFSTGSVHTLSDSAVATRDIVDAEAGSGISYSVTPATEGANYLWAHRASDGVRGKVYVTTGIEIARGGGRDGGGGLWGSYITDGDSRNNRFLYGEFDGAIQHPDGSFTYTPMPVSARNGDNPPTYGTWEDTYTAQATLGSYAPGIVDKFREKKSGQFTTLDSDTGASLARRGKGTGKYDNWLPNYDTHMFPSLYPVSVSGGESVGGIKAFATVTDGIITKTTITDHGAAVFNEDAGEVAKGPEWRAAYHSNYPTSSDHGTFLGKTILSNKAEDIISNLPYVAAQMQAIENGTAISNYGTSGCGTAADPLAQTFTIPGQTPDEPNRHGVFVCGIDLWFAEKGTNDVDVELREVVNGYPGQQSMWCVGGHSKAEAVLQYEEINIRLGTIVEGTPGSGYPDANDPESYTTALFPAPAYLLPGRDYCVVVRCAESTEFFLWCSDSRGNILGSFDSGETTRAQDVNVDHAKGGSHYGGSLFLSQNAKTWEPDQYKDMMFRLRIADFTSTTGQAVFKAGTKRYVRDLGTPTNPNPEAVEQSLQEDYQIDYFKVQTEERLPIGHDDKEGTITYMYNVPDLDGARTGGDILNTTGALTYLSNSVMLEAGKEYDKGSFHLTADITALGGGNADRKVSPIIDLSKFKLTTWRNYISDGGIQDGDIKFAHGVGEDYNVGDTFTLTPAVTKEHPAADIGKIQVASNNSLGGITSMNVHPIGAGTAGRRYHRTPTVTDDGTGSGVLANVSDAIKISGETNSKGGNCNFRYVTKPVKLKSGLDAMDISVTMDVCKPQGSHVYVYYKVKHKDDPESFDSKNWVLMKQTQPKDNRPSILGNSWMASEQFPMMEHTYSTYGDDEISYTDNNGNIFQGFKFFAIKIVGVADNSAQPPIVGNLRAIAVT